MIQLLQKIFKKKAIEDKPIRKYVDGFYVDTNSIEEKSKSVWSEWIMTPDGVKPIFPDDRIEIH